MIGTTAALVTLRPDLAPALMEFDLEANQRQFVATRIAPVVEVDSAFGNWARIPLKELLKTQNTNRNANGSYGRANRNFKPETFATVEHGFEERVDDRNAVTFGSYFDAELIAAAFCRHVVLQGLEQRTITALIAGVYAATAAGTAWTTPASATPIDNVRTAALAIFARTGVWPNQLTLSKTTFEYLKDNAQIIDRLKYAGFQNPNRDNINEQAVAQALGLQEVLVAGAVYNSANEGQAASLATIWPAATALLAVSARTSNPMEPCFARIFHWGGDGSSIGTAFESYRDETVRGDIVRARMQTDEKIMFTEAAQSITGVA